MRVRVVGGSITISRLLASLIGQVTEKEVALYLAAYPFQSWYNLYQPPHIYNAKMRARTYRCCKVFPRYPGTVPEILLWSSLLQQGVDQPCSPHAIHKLTLGCFDSRFKQKNQPEIISQTHRPRDTCSTRTVCRAISSLPGLCPSTCCRAASYSSRASLWVRYVD